MDAVTGTGAGIAATATELHEIHPPPGPLPPGQHERPPPGSAG